MHTFLLDLWHDMREKRLWPFAALLLVAIAAVPFTLREKGAPAPPPVPTPTQAQTAADKLPTISLDEIASKSPSNLTEFSERNPFKSLADLPKTPPKDLGENQSVDLGESPDSKSSSGGSSGGSGGSSGGSSGSSGSTGGSGSGAGSYVGPRTTYYAYRADIRFGLAGKAKAMKQVEAFTLLGDEKEPAAMFMGVTDDHKWAVFAVDTAHYEAQGEHECKPTPERCEFVYLKVAGDANETTFTTLDGSKSYDLELTAIKRVILNKEDVENVPTEEDKSKSDASKKREKADPLPLTLFDILAKRR
jgi:hypothetical protein